MAPPLIQLKDIRLTFGGTPLLSGVELSVSSGEVTGGPKSYSPRDRSAFLSALDQTIRRIQRQRAQQPAPNQD